MQFLRAHCRRLLQSGPLAAVRPLPVSSLHLLTRFTLQEVTRPTATISRTSTRYRANTIATALSDWTVFDSDSLFKFDAVFAARDGALFAFLRIFVGGGLGDPHA